MEVQSASLPQRILPQWCGVDYEDEAVKALSDLQGRRSMALLGKLTD
jgi:hypothetical protein